MRDAWLLADTLRLDCAEKFLTILGRFVVHGPHFARGGKGQGLLKLVSAQLRLGLGFPLAGGVWGQSCDASGRRPA